LEKINCKVRIMKTLQILWIEDQHNLLKQIVYPLQKDKHIIIFVRTFFEAKQEIEKQMNDGKTFDCIILDLIIPTGDKNENTKPSPLIGLELLEDIINKYNFHSKKILVFTVVRDSNLNKRVRKFDVYDIVHKGRYLPSELKKTVYEMVGLNSTT